MWKNRGTSSHPRWLGEGSYSSPLEMRGSTRRASVPPMPHVSLRCWNPAKVSLRSSRVRMHRWARQWAIWLESLSPERGERVWMAWRRSCRICRSSSLPRRTFRELKRTPLLGSEVVTESRGWTGKSHSGRSWKTAWVWEESSAHPRRLEWPHQSS